jgi:hypothetical protein
MKRFWHWLLTLFGHAAVPRTRVDLCAHALDSTSLVVAKTLGAAWIRYTLYVAQTRLDPAARDAFIRDVRAAQAAGLNVLVVAHQEPAEWKSLPLEERYQQFALYCRDVAALVPGCGWEFFNEMEETGFDDLFRSGGSYEVAGKRYGDFLNVAAPLVRPFATAVVSGGIGARGIEGGFITGMLSRVAPGTLDAICTHAYGFSVEGQFQSNYAGVKAAGWAGPQWCTEYGQNDTQVSADPHTDFDTIQEREIMGCTTRNPGYAKLFLYVLHSPGESNTGFPIFRQDWSQRRTATAIREWNATFQERP